MKKDIFDLERLPPALTEFIRSTNPWWEGKPGRVLPPFRRWAFAPTRAKLEAGLAPIVVLRGPRRMGKTTIQEQLIQDLLQEGIESRRILRVQFDELPPLKGLDTPILTLCRWFENRVLGETKRPMRVALFMSSWTRSRTWTPGHRSSSPWLTTTPSTSW